MSASLFLFKRKEIIVPVKKLDVTAEKLFIRWNRGKRTNTKTLQEYRITFRSRMLEVKF
jgi:hypothetical protein